MAPYFLLLGLFTFGALVSGVDPRRDKPLGFLALGWLVLVLMIGLRWQVGADWATYAYSWKIAGTKSLIAFRDQYGRDTFFYDLMWTFRHRGLPYWSFTLAMAAIFSTGLIAFARTQANPWLAATVAVPYLVIVVAMSGMRQASAIGLIFLALVAVQRQHAIKFLIYIALAAVFHASAILVLPLAGLSFARTKIQSSILVTATAVGAYFTLLPAFSKYSESYLSGSDITSSGTLVRIGTNFIPAVIFLVFRKRFPIPEHEALLWRNFSIASVLTLVALYFISSTTALDRLGLYLFPLQMFVFSWVPWLLKRPAERVILALVLFMYFAAQLYVFLSFGTNGHSYIPYRTIFDQQ